MLKLPQKVALAHDIVGIYLVEVAPAYNRTDRTSILAAQILLTLLGFMMHARQDCLPEYSIFLNTAPGGIWQSQIIEIPHLHATFAKKSALLRHFIHHIRLTLPLPGHNVRLARNKEWSNGAASSRYPEKAHGPVAGHPTGTPCAPAKPGVFLCAQAE